MLEIQPTVALNALAFGFLRKSYELFVTKGEGFAGNAEPFVATAEGSPRTMRVLWQLVDGLRQTLENYR